MAPPLFTRRQLAQHATLSESDLELVRRCRMAHTRCGLAYQLGFTKMHGRLPRHDPLETIPELVVFLSLQCREDPSLLARYEKNRRTIFEHRDLVREHLGLRRMGEVEQAELEAFVFDMARRLEHAGGLQLKAWEFLREQKIILPAESAITRIVGEQRARARQGVFEAVAETIPPILAERMDRLLIVDTETSTSGLQRIKETPGTPSANALLSLLGKIELIESTGALEVDISWLSRNYQRSMFHYARTGTVDLLRRLSQSRRRATLLCFLWQAYGDAVDQVIDMFDKMMTRALAQAQKRLDERLLQQRKLISKSMSALRKVGSVLLDDSVPDTDVRDRLFEKVSREDLAGYVDEVQEWVSGRNSDPFLGFIKSYGHLRKFSPVLLETIEFESSGASSSACLDGIKTLIAINRTRKRKLPSDVPLDFVPRRLLRFVAPEEGVVDRRAWECALLLSLRDEIRSGNVAVVRSKRFGRLDDFFMPFERWEERRSRFFARAGLPENPADVEEHLRRRLNDAFDGFLEGAPDNEFAKVDESGWKLASEPAEQPDTEQLARLKIWLGRRARTISLPNLLIEVDNELNFTHHFFPPGQRGKLTQDDICVTLVALLAHGCNLGPHKMSELTSGVTYKQLKRVGDWRFTQDSQRAALALLAQSISALDTAEYWGDGKTSASDGQRFALPRKVLQQTYSTKFSDFALEFYTFVVDNYAPLYSTPIECSDRDAAFVLDGLLYNESELDLEEHYTDTHGYTELNFAAFAMLGRRFCPRIKGLQRQRIYRIDRDREYGSLEPLVGHANRTIDIKVIVDEWDRLGQLFASLEEGHATASVVLKRLAGYSGKNRIYRASRELGRIFKTEFILSYLSKPELRSRVRKGLLKVEQLHSLSRDVFYGRRGRIKPRELWEQMNSCSCLTLIVACIIYWQAREMSRAIRQGDPEGDGIDISMLKHISPIEWSNVILYGTYKLNRSRIRRPHIEPPGSVQLTL